MTSYVAPAVKTDLRRGRPLLLHLARFGDGQVPGLSISFCGKIVERERGYHSPLPYCPVCLEVGDPHPASRLGESLYLYDTTSRENRHFSIGAPRFELGHTTPANTGECRVVGAKAVFHGDGHAAA